MDDGKEGGYWKSDGERGSIQGHRKGDYAETGEGSVKAPSWIEVVWR